MNGLMNIYTDDLTSLIKSFRAHASYPITRIKQLSLNDYVATSCGDYTIKIWHPANNWNLVQTYSKHTYSINALEHSNLGLIASGGGDRIIHIWSISTAQTQQTINTNSDVYSLKFLNNDHHLAAGFGNGKINIYNFTMGNLIATLSGHLSNVNDLVLMSGERNLLASSSDDRTIRIWDLNTYTNRHVLNGHASYVYGLKQVSVDVLSSGSWDKTIKLWNTTTGQLTRTLSNHTDRIYWSLDMLDDGVTLVSGSNDRAIKLWDSNTGECLRTLSTSLIIDSLAYVNPTTAISK